MPTILRDSDKDRRMSTESGEVRPRYVDRPVVCDRDGLVVGELPVRSARLALALEGADQRERIIPTASGPGAAAVRRAGEPQGDLLAAISEAGEVGGVPVGAERDGGIAAEIIR